MKISLYLRPYVQSCLIELLHLFASILGNDYIPAAVFENIFASIKLPKKTKACSERHRKIRGLLAWLGKESRVGPAIDRLLSCYPATHRAQLKVSRTEATSLE
jgi:hypothetical protein